MKMKILLDLPCTALPYFQCNASTFTLLALFPSSGNSSSLPKQVALFLLSCLYQEENAPKRATHLREFTLKCDFTELVYFICTTINPGNGSKALKDLLDDKVSVVVQSEQSLGQMGVAESTSSPQVFLIMSKIIHKAMFP